MNEPIPGALYVPAQGQRIVMPGNQPDWPIDGQPVDILKPYQRRLVIDGDLALKQDAETSNVTVEPPNHPVDDAGKSKPVKIEPVTTGEDSHDASQ